MSLFNRTGRFFFEWRDKLPVPLALLMPAMARPRLLGWLCGVPMIVAGEAIRVWSIMHIGPTTRTRKICADQLVTSGPYSYCRNPLYLSNMLKIAGVVAVAGNAMFAILALLFYTIEFCCMIPYEESFLQERFPEEFSRYRQLVPAILPRKEQRLAAKASYSLSEALKSERKTFASTGVILALLALVGILRKESRV